MPKQSPMSEFDNALCKRIFFSMPGLSDGKIGKILGLHRQSIQGWKSGKSRPTLSQIETITRYTEIDWNWITTGKTTSHKSVINAYLPKLYNSEIIKNHDFYILCRNIAEKLISTGNSKLFLHPMKVLYARSLIKPSTSLNSFNASITTPDLLSLCSTIEVPEDIDKNIEILYKKMSKAYCPVETHNHSNTAYKAGLTPTEIIDSPHRAYSNFNDIVYSKAEFTNHERVRDNSIINIVGSAMSPLISNGQQIITGERLTSAHIAKLVNKLVIITVRVAEQKELSATLCKKASHISKDSILLTSQDDTIEPMVFHLTQIVAIHPVKAILFT